MMTQLFSYATKYMLESYGHVQLNIFYFHLVYVDPSGFIYKRKRYRWMDVAHVDVRQIERFGFGSMSHLILVPRAHIQLSDGRTMIIRGHTLVKRRGVLRKGYDSPFSELVALFEEKRRVALYEELERNQKLVTAH